MNSDLDFNPLATLLHGRAVAAGWWDEYPNRADRYELAVQLASSELAEAMEGDRKGLKDTHLPEHDMFDVELADFAIRQLDLAGALGVSVHFNNEVFQLACDILATLSRPVQLGRINATLFVGTFVYALPPTPTRSKK